MICKKKSKLKGFAFVIDTSNNMPIVDNPSSVPDEEWVKLTPEQQSHCNSIVQPEFRKEVCNV